MKKGLLTLLCLGSLLVFANSDVSLKGVTKTTNIYVDSVDTKDILLKVDERMDKFDFNTLKNDQEAVKKHLNRIYKVQNNLKELATLRSEMELNYIDIKQLEDEIEKFKKFYDRKINRIYKQNSAIDRYAYILVASKGDLDYKQDLENFVIDKFAIKKYDQTTTLKKSLASTQMQNIIKTEKDFGQKSVEGVYDFVIRANGVVFKVFKITQNPFIKSPLTTQSKVIVSQNNQFAGAKVSLYDMKDFDFELLKSKLNEQFNLPLKAVEPFIENIKSKVNLDVYRLDFEKSSNKIVEVLKQLENTHKKLAQKGSELQFAYKTKKDLNSVIEQKLATLLASTQKLLKPYNMRITKETIGNITISTPKIYSETVQYKEEKEYIHRKVKSYISKINISDLKQSDTLIDFSDLSSITKNQHKFIEFETVDILPFLDSNNKIGLLVFASIEIKNKLDEDDLLSFDFKYDTVKFIPVKRGYQTIFAAQTEVTLGLVKEFLETNSPKRYFDQYCIDNSFLPEEAKDFKNVDKEYYRYPAVCFKVDRIGDFIKWVSDKTKRDIVIPDAKVWGYVASNSDTTDYCWGNQTPEELIEEEILPENIYLDNLNQESSIMEVAKFPKSKLGLYDMCGNVFELTLQDGEFTYKGNSFSSYIEISNVEAEYYSDEVNPSLGLRLFYLKDLTNE